MGEKPVAGVPALQVWVLRFESCEHRERMCGGSVFTASVRTLHGTWGAGEHYERVRAAAAKTVRVGTWGAGEHYERVRAATARTTGVVITVNEWERLASVFTVSVGALHGAWGAGEHYERVRAAAARTVRVGPGEPASTMSVCELPQPGPRVWVACSRVCERPVCVLDRQGQCEHSITLRTHTYQPSAQHELVVVSSERCL
jgi:hypothetical protein